MTHVVEFTAPHPRCGCPVTYKASDVPPRQTVQPCPTHSRALTVAVEDARAQANERTNDV